MSSNLSTPKTVLELAWNSRHLASLSKFLLLIAQKGQLAGSICKYTATPPPKKLDRGRGGKVSNVQSYTGL